MIRASFWLVIAIAVVLPIQRASGADVELKRQITEAINTRFSKHDFMGAVLVARGDAVILDKAYGEGNLEWHVPNAPDTRFRIASLTKQFTAAGILLLQERGKLRVEDHVSQYVPDAPEAWRSITLCNLLTHTSGTAALPTTPEKLVARLRDKPLDFQTGTDFRYSNSGYILLGYIIERVAGQPYREFIRDNIFVPLAMGNSGYDSNSEILAKRAQGYLLKDGSLKNAGYLDMTVPFSAGGLYSTTHDLLRWEHGVFDGRLFSPNSLAEMTTPNVKDYAFGIAVDSDARGKKVIWHGGAIDGFNTFLAYVPSERFAVIVLANIEGASARALAIEILNISGHHVAALK